MIVQHRRISQQVVYNPFVIVYQQIQTMTVDIGIHLLSLLLQDTKQILRESAREPPAMDVTKLQLETTFTSIHHCIFYFVSL